MFSIADELTRCREQRKLLAFNCQRALEELHLELQENLFYTLRHLLVERKALLRCEIQKVSPKLFHILHSEATDSNTKRQAKEILKKIFEDLTKAMEIGSARGNLDKKEHSLEIFIDRW